MKIYQAGPLFTDAERRWHVAFRAELEAAGHEVVWPGELITDELLRAWGADSARRVMETDRDALLACDAAVALLDGAQVDDGTAWEIGYACAVGIPVVGIRTDFRRCGDTDAGVVNAMIQGSVACVARDIPGALAALERLKK